MRCLFSILSLGLSLVVLPTVLAEAPKRLAQPMATDAKPVVAKLTSRIFEVGWLIETPLSGAAVVEDTKAKNAQTCLELISVMVRPATWELSGTGGAGQIEFIAASESLCVTNSPEVLAEIEQLLASLRKLQDRKVAQDVQIVAGSDTSAGRPAANHVKQAPVVLKDQDVKK